MSTKDDGRGKGHQALACATSMMTGSVAATWLRARGGLRQRLAAATR